MACRLLSSIVCPKTVQHPQSWKAARSLSSMSLCTASTRVRRVTSTRSCCGSTTRPSPPPTQSWTIIWLPPRGSRRRLSPCAEALTGTTTSRSGCGPRQKMGPRCPFPWCTARRPSSVTAVTLFCWTPTEPTRFPMMCTSRRSASRCWTEDSCLQLPTCVAAVTWAASGMRTASTCTRRTRSRTLWPALSTSSPKSGPPKTSFASRGEARGALPWAL
mmetsp:Transcript_18414/g.55509  ORF Transcript_18414/g.55509 Transcript_18414/m.55509 type:complete len:217 (-) Transcript_18414:1487-2137(-)